MLLNRPGRSVFVERALGHTWKNGNHRIRSIILIHVRHSQHIRTVRHERSAQETIDHHDIDDHIQKVQHFTKEITERIAVVHFQTAIDVMHKPTLARRSLFRGNRQHATQSVGDHSHFAILPVLPDHVRHVEADALEEQHERHPLIVAVIRFRLVIVAQTTLGHLRPNTLSMLAGQREGVGDPAVGADHVARYRAIVDTLNWIT